MTTVMGLPRSEFCHRFFYGMMELSVAILVFILSAWYIQSKQLVIEHIDPPKVVEVAKDYIDVQWHNRKLLDCPATGTPAFYTPIATEILPTRPVASGLEEATFVRRYHIPPHLVGLHIKNADPKANYMAELHIAIEATCNPLFRNQQLIKIPFKMVLS